MATISSTIAINDAFSSSLNKLSSGLSKSQSGFQKLKSALSGNTFTSATTQSQGLFKSVASGTVVGSLISKAMGTATSGIRSMVTELNEASVSWQTFEGNMRQIGRTPAQIASAKKDMQQFAQQTIYSASDMSSTYSQLASVGVKNTGRLVKGFGGLAAAATNPTQAMKTLSEQATQMAAKPKVQWMDFKLMLEQTPAGMAAVAKTMGTDLQGLISKIQDGTVASEDFLDAIAKTGTSANFSKMATEYKTIGQAMDGLRETLANGLQPAFDKVGKVGIKVVSEMTDAIGEINFDKIGDTLVNVLNKIISTARPIMTQLGSGFKQIFEGFTNTPAIAAVASAFDTVSESVQKLLQTMSQKTGGTSIFTEIGRISGTAITTVANAISGIAKVIGELDPTNLKMLGAAFLTLKFGVQGLALTGVVSALSQLNNLNPSQLERVAQAITVLTTAFAAFKISGEIAGSIVNMVTGIQSAIAGLSEILEGLGLTLSASFGPLLAVVVAVTGVIAGAVMAWQENFLNFRSTVEGIFSNLDSIFAPLISAFNQLKEVAGPALEGLWSAIKPILEIAGIGAFSAIAVGIGLIADALTSVAGVASAVVSGITAIVKGFSALGNAIKFDFSAAKNDLNEAKEAVGQVGNALSRVGRTDNVQNVIASLSKLGSTAKTAASEVNNTKISPKVDVASLNSQLNSMKNQKITTKVEPQVDIASMNAKLAGIKSGISTPTVKAKAQLDTSSVTQQLNQLGNSTNTTAKVKAQLDTNSVTQQLNQLGSGTNATAKVKAQLDTSSLTQQLATLTSANNATIKVKAQLDTSSVTQQLATLTSGQISTLKITPQVDMTTVNTALASISARTIPGPKVSAPNMSGVVSAVRAGMTAAAAAASAGGAQLAAAVRNAVNAAVAAARSAAGAMRSAGVMIGQGLAQGLQSQVGAVAAAADALVAAANRAARAKAQIHSPSKLFAEVGNYIAQGLAVGMQSATGLISKASHNMINAANVSSAVGTLGDFNQNKATVRVVDDTPLVSANTVTSNGITPQSAVSNNIQNITPSNSKTTVTIDKGAITINSTGNTEYDADRLLSLIEDKILEQAGKSLI